MKNRHYHSDRRVIVIARDETPYSLYVDKVVRKEIAVKDWKNQERQRPKRRK